jgi:hypothetical protein
MNDDELGQQLKRSIDRRVQTVTPRVDVEELLVRTQHRLGRQRRVLVAALAAMLAIGGLAGYFVAQAAGDDGSGTTVALDDGAPGFASPAPGFEPANIEATRTAITRAFHSAFDGGVSSRERFDAIQNGASVQALAQEVQRNAARFGYSAEQLAGTSISVLAPRFIDATHAIVQFSLAVPGHGVILVDRIGYAVLVDGRWKVALRTYCDLLSLNGLGRQCPPVPTTSAAG